MGEPEANCRDLMICVCSQDSSLKLRLHFQLEVKFFMIELKMVNEPLIKSKIKKRESEGGRE